MAHLFREVVDETMTILYFNSKPPRKKRLTYIQMLVQLWLNVTQYVCWRCKPLIATELSAVVTSRVSCGQYILSLQLWSLITLSHVLEVTTTSGHSTHSDIFISNKEISSFKRGTFYELLQNLRYIVQS